MQVPFFNSLRFRIGFGFIVLIVINVAVMVWTVYNFGRLSSAITEILSHNYPSVIAVENMALSVEHHDKAVHSFLNGDINNGKIELALAKDEFYQYFNQTQEEMTSDLNKAILEDIQSTYSGYLLLIDSLQHLVEARKYLIAREFHYDGIVPFYDRLNDNCFWLIEETQKSMLQVSGQTKLIANDAVIAIISASIFAMIFSIFVIIQFTRRIIIPAEKITSTVSRIGRGQLDLKIDVQSSDEFGLLSREFNKMTERLRRFEAMNIDEILLEKQKSETIVTSLRDAIVVSGADGTILHVNEGAEELFGLQRNQMMGKPVADLTNDPILNSIFRTQEQSNYFNQPFIEFISNGKTTYLHPRISPILSRYGEREGTVFILQDVSEFKELDKMKSDFMATVSHEFRTPVTSMTMGADILRQRLLGPLTKAQEDLLESFKQDCDRLTKLVRDLLQLSKLESGKAAQREEHIQIKKLILSAVNQLQIQFNERGINLIVTVPETLPTILGDEQQLSWVIVNLLNNALQYTSQGGKVELSACAKEDTLRLMVKDTGKGIPREYFDKIFDKFVQVKHPNDPTPGSVGLGLSIVKDIVEMYGGKIWVESEVNKGSTFTVELPLSQGEEV